MGERVERQKKAMLADVRLSTLGRYVEALGGRLDVRAVLPDRSVELDVGRSGRRPRGAG